MAKQLKDNHTHIESISPEAAELLASKNHAIYGTLLLTSLSNYTGVAGVSPVGDYAGFYVGGSGVTITAITYTTPDKHKTYSTEIINDLELVAGQYYAIDGIKQVTISAGALLLVRKNN